MAEEAARLPAHLEVAGLIRRVQAEGGFAMVLARGERDAGTILLILNEKGAESRAFERMPRPDGTRGWHCSKTEAEVGHAVFAEWQERRRQQDPDLWIVELDIPQGERFIGL